MAGAESFAEVNPVGVAPGSTQEDVHFAAKLRCRKIGRDAIHQPQAFIAERPSLITAVAAQVASSIGSPRSSSALSPLPARRAT
jgi:hypothetical protein